MEIYEGGGRCFAKYFTVYFIVQAIVVCIGGIYSILKGNPKFVCFQALNFVWMSAGEYYTKYGLLQTGTLWFLLALAWARMLFGLILNRSNYYMVLCIMLSAVAYMIMSCISDSHYVPTFILQGVGALQFLAFGYYFKHETVDMRIVLLLILCWPCAIIFGHVEMYTLDYKHYLLSIMGACGGTLTLYFSLRWLRNITKISNALRIVAMPIYRAINWCGMYSLVILCMHYIDERTNISWTIMDHLLWHMSGICMSIYRICLALLIAFLYVRLKEYIVRNSRRNAYA